MSEVRSASLFEFAEGSGFIGENKDVILRNFRFITGHVFTKKDGSPAVRADGGAVKPKTVLAIDIEVKDPDDPEHAKTTQYLSIGDPEHYQASTDNKTPAQEGGYVVLTGTYDNIWTRCSYGIWMSELLSLEPTLAPALAAGINVLDSIDVHYEGKVLPMGKVAKPTDKEQKILIPTKINAMPNAQQKGKGGAAAKSTSGTAKAATPATAAGSGAAAGGGGVDDTKVVAYLKTALAAAGGSSTKKDAAKAVFKLASDAKEGADIGPLTKRVNDDVFLGGLTDVMYDADSGVITAL